MSHLSLHVSSDNPITPQHLDDALASLPTSVCPTPIKIKDSEKADYTAILAGSYELFQRVAALPDYQPKVDREKYPRQDVGLPTGKEKESNAWAHKCTVKGGKGVLEGRTICLKDNIALADVPCAVGTAYIKDWKPQTDATVATRVLDAGATITGKAVCENLSYFGASISSNTGHMDNVYAKGYSAGGSSSGCGVLIGRGECDMGIGGDQGGSIRLPAAHNGIVGFKPTHGLVPYTGIALCESTIDTTGPMTKDVLDNALLLSVLAGADGIDDRQLAGCPLPGQVPDYVSIAKQGIKGMKIGIITESLQTELTDDRYAKAVVDAAQKFRDLGAAVVEQVSFPDFNNAPDIWAVIARLSVQQMAIGRNCGRKSLYLNDFTKKFFPITQEKFDDMWPSLVVTLTTGAYAWANLDPTLIGKAYNLARKYKDETDALLSKYDILITPTMPRLPLRIDDITENSSPLQKMSKAGGVSLTTAIYSMTGHPALSIPIGFLPVKDEPNVRLPMGMQIVGKFYDEGTIYRAAYAWEQANDWKSM